MAEFDGEEQPVARAHVEIHLPDNEDLVGVATTNYAGRFSINELSNPLTQSEQPLSRKQDYLVQIRSPEHYILTGTLRFEYGSEEWTFVLIHKDNSLRSDKTVTPSLNPEADATLSMGGAVRKGS